MGACFIVAVVVTVLTAARAVLAAAPQHLGTTVYVDGLPKARLRWQGTQLRRLSIRNNKVSGVRKEEADALMRLADAVAGFCTGRCRAGCRRRPRFSNMPSTRGTSDRCDKQTST